MSVPAPAPGATPTRWHPLLAASLLLLLGHEALLLGRNVDDAWISYRYARNLAEGAGLVFNAGERVEGYTNFLLVLFQAAFLRAGLPVDRSTRILCMAASLLTLLVVHRGGYRIAPDSRAPATLVAPFTYVGMLWATLYGLAIFGHLPDTWSFVGMGVIVASGVWLMAHERRLHRR